MFQSLASDIRDRNRGILYGQGRRENLFSGLSITNGLNKSSKFLKICFAAWLLPVVAACSASNSADMTSLQNENAAIHNLNGNASDKNVPVNQENSKTTAVKNDNSKTLDCNDPNGYSLVVVTDPERESQNLGTVPRILNIVVGDEVKTAIKIPTDSDAMGFSLSSTEKTKEGFEITIEYGSRYYYQKQFNFICKEDNFYLYKVKIESFDKNDPESMDNWDKKEIQIKPNLPIEKFSLFDYLTVK